MKRWGYILTIAALALLAACQKSKSPTCSLDGGTELAVAPWPKFRADTVNSGRAPNVDLTGSTGDGIVLFEGYCSFTTSQACNANVACPTGETCEVPRHCSLTTSRPCTTNGDCPQQPPEICAVPIGPISTTPLVGPDSPMGGPTIYLASSDGNVYVLNPPFNPTPDPTPGLTDSIRVNGAILGTPLLGADGTLFVPSNGLLSQFNPDGTQKNGASVAGFVVGSPNIWVPPTPGHDGTVYFATNAGIFTGVCPNGIPRFSLTFPPSQSSVALVLYPNSTPDDPEPIIVAGGTNGQVRAYNVRGRQYWSFSASANIVAASLIDPTTDLFYVADTSGHVFAGTLVNGQPDPDFSFAPAQLVPPVEAPATITASPALGRDTAPLPKLYVAAQSLIGQTPEEQRGVLYALDRATGKVCWTFEAEGPISSSPAVATGGVTDVVVFASDVLEVLDPSKGPVATGGRVYAVPDRDDDRCDGEPRCLLGEVDCPLWVFDPASIDPPGHSYTFGAASPSIGADGTVYIGRGGSRRSDSADECKAPSAPPCVVNDGGVLYAINAP